MGTAKWRGGVAIVRSTSASHAPVTGYKYPVCGSALIEGVPIVFRRTPNIMPYTDYQFAGGFDYSWKIDNISPSPDIMGYLAWLTLGGNTWTTGTQSLFPADDLSFCNILVDRGLDLGTSVPTERLVGAKVTGWALECKLNQLAKLSLSGIGCNLGANAAALVPTVPTGTNNAPMSWASLRGTGGYFKVAIGTGTATQDDDIVGFGVSYQRPAAKSGITLGSPQPAAINSGIGVVTFNFDKEFSGASALAQYNAWKAQSEIAISAAFTMGTNSVQLGSIQGLITGSVAKEIGEGEEAILAKVEVEAYKQVAQSLISFAVKDGSTGIYV